MIKSMIMNVRYVKLMQIQQEALEKLSVFSAKVRAENTRFMRGRTELVQGTRWTYVLLMICK